MRYLLAVLAVLIFSLLTCTGSNDKKHFTGVLEGHAVQVPALIGGEIIRIFVDEGYEVLSGDTIAVIDTLEYSLQLKKITASFKELDVQMKSAKSQLKQAETDYEYVKDNQRRTKILYNKGTATKQALDDLTNQLYRAETNLVNAKQNIEKIKSNREQLLANAELIQKKIRDAVIRAPIPGIVATKYYEVSEAIIPMNPIVEIIDLGVLDVKIYISETLLPHIQYGQEVSVKIDGSDQRYAGTVSWISSKAEFTPKSILTEETRTSLVYAVKIKIKNPEGVLKHGMPVEISL